jgi:hypothetical protein
VRAAGPPPGPGLAPGAGKPQGAPRGWRPRPRPWPLPTGPPRTFRPRPCGAATRRARPGRRPTAAARAAGPPGCPAGCPPSCEGCPPGCQTPRHRSCEAGHRPSGGGWTRRARGCNPHCPRAAPAPANQRAGRRPAGSPPLRRAAGRGAAGAPQRAACRPAAPLWGAGPAAGSCSAHRGGSPRAARPWAPERTPARPSRHRTPPLPCPRRARAPSCLRRPACTGALAVKGRTRETGGERVCAWADVSGVTGKRS